MLRVLLVPIAIVLYEIARYLVLKTSREALRKRARAFAEQHGVRIDPFKFGGKALIREQLLNDRVIGQAMQTPADRERVEEYIDEIVPAFSLTAYFQVGMKLARAAIRAVYKPIVVRPAPELPQDATAVFLINHRSNFDYVVVGWALARQVAISYAVGEWARVFPLDALFKAFGGFFVRRGFPDPLYHTVLKRYLQLITRQGITQGIFPEGGLTRDGALRSPKVGLLDSILQLSEERELYFVPVGINYDRVLEDDALLAELRGRDKPPTPGEKAMGFVRLLWVLPSRVVINVARAATGRLHRAGYVAVAFGEPVRFRDMPQSQRLHGLTDEQRRALAKEVAGELMQKIARVIPATPVPLVARAALDLREATENALAVRVRELRTQLEEQHVPVALGREFDAHRAARKELHEDLERNRDLLRLETDVLATEEAERIVQIGVSRLLRRKAISQRDGRIKAERQDLLEYYAKSLEVPWNAESP